MKRVAVVALLALALAGCSVPGQTLSPGTAYSRNGVEVSNAHIDEIYQAWVTSSNYQLNPNRLQIMVMDALRDPAIDIVVELEPEAEVLFTDENATFFAKQLLAVKGVEGEPDPLMVESVKSAMAVSLIVYTDPDGTYIQRLAEDLEASVEGSPRAGSFDAELFYSSLSKAMQAVETQRLPLELAYVEFYRLDGFVSYDGGGLRVVAPEQ